MKNGQKLVDICFTPAEYPYYKMREQITVIIDIFRFTSTVCTILHRGATQVMPCQDRQETLSMKDKAYITAGERNGDKLEGFELGNSPFDYINNDIQGKKIALTTTNGTKAINIAKDSEITIGSFLNLKAVTSYVVRQNKNVLLLCSGWKNRINYEDTIFAGVLVENILKHSGFTFTSDSIGIAKAVCKAAKGNMYNYILDNCSRVRNKLHKLDEDIKYCLQQDITNIVPVLQGNILVRNDKN